MREDTVLRGQGTQNGAGLSSGNILVTEVCVLEAVGVYSFYWALTGGGLRQASSMPSHLQTDSDSQPTAISYLQ